MFNFINENGYGFDGNQEVIEQSKILGKPHPANYIEHTRMWFTNLSAALLFYWEELGQISDGKYENSNPGDHWRWLPVPYKFNDAIQVNPRFKPYSIRKINTKSWSIIDRPKKYTIGDKESLEVLSYRMLCYGRFGKALPNDTASFLKFCDDGFDSIVERLGDEKKFEYVDEFLDDLFEHDCKWIRNKDMVYNKFTQKEYDAYYNTSYTMADLKKDLKIMDVTVNTCEASRGSQN